MDVQVPYKAGLPLSKHGFKIVVRAGAGVPDHVWVAQAIKANVDIIVSGDTWVLDKAVGAGIETVDLDKANGIRGIHLTAWLLQRLKGARNRILYSKRKS